MPRVCIPLVRNLLLLLFLLVYCLNRTKLEILSGGFACNGILTRRFLGSKGSLIGCSMHTIRLNGYRLVSNCLWLLSIKKDLEDKTATQLGDMDPWEFKVIPCRNCL